MDEKAKIAAWIAKALEKPGKSQTGLAQALGITQPNVHQLVHGRRSLKVEEIPATERYLDEPFPFGILSSGVYEVDGVAGKMPVLHTVAAGVWHEVDSAMDAVLDYVNVGEDPEYRARRQYAVRVVGESMNLIFAHGTYAIVVEAAGEQPQHRDLVIVRRTQGGKIERTIKRYWVTPKGAELRPETTETSRYKPLPIGGDPDTTIEIEGFVIGKHEKLGRKTR